jgi:capsular polysaccharide biosynthesis protein
LKQVIKKGLIHYVNKFNVSSKYIGTPKGIISTSEWLQKNNNLTYQEIYPAKKVQNPAPLTLDANVHAIYKNEYECMQPPAFVATIPNARVWGRYGAVITSDDLLLTDVSREFGRYGGVFGTEHSVFKQLKLAPVETVKGRVAVVACAGSNNYHHWLYDTLPRIHLLKASGLFDTIDWFVMDYTGIPYQKESIKLLGIDETKILCSNDHWKFHIQAEELVVPSLPAVLGRISDWTVTFLRNLFLAEQKPNNTTGKGLYLSRAKAPSRKLLNETEIKALLNQYNCEPFFPEDYSIQETAAMFSNAPFICGVHGSGFANLAFCTVGTNVIDFVAPLHLDAYYWIISNRTGSNYAYLFAEGDRPDEHQDLVANKVDKDLLLNVNELALLMSKMNMKPIK